MPRSPLLITSLMIFPACEAAEAEVASMRKISRGLAAMFPI